MSHKARDRYRDKLAVPEELIAARAALVADIVGRMPKEHRQFLVGFKEGAPDWGLRGMQEARNLPAVRWKQLNLDRLKPEDRQRLVAELKAALPENA